MERSSMAITGSQFCVTGVDVDQLPREVLVKSNTS
jgi:hypothetical protein